MKNITFDEIKNNPELNAYIQKGNEHLGTLGYTDHSAAHTMKVSEKSAEILSCLGFPARMTELARIAGYIHDIGNAISRHNHAQTGALMAFTLLTKIDMNPEEIAAIISAIGNHDEDLGIATNPVAAALIIADKTDVRRSRVRDKDFSTFDIHDRVNYAVEKSELAIRPDNRSICLDIVLDTKICSVMDYFEIFLVRMLMCKRAAEFLGTSFELNANNTRLM